jgi:cytoskeletal protein RodZ
MNTKSSSMLTYVLYGLLGLFIVTAAYYACQKQKEKREQAAREKAEMEKTLQDMGYGTDETGSGSSHFAAEDTAVKPIKPEPTTAVNGTESKTTAPVTTKPTETKATDTKIITQPTTTTTKPTATKPTTTTTTKPKSAVKGPGTGRWVVRAGTLSYMDGARRRLEEVIRAGYPNAEIVKTSTGKAAVVVFRSNDKNAAIRVADQLEMKGIDAAVFDK